MSPQHVLEYITLLGQSKNVARIEKVGYDTNPDASPQPTSMNKGSIPKGAARNERNDNVLLDQRSSMSDHEDMK